MAIVTVTGEVGSFATDIAAEVARELDYAMADRELMIEGAAARGWTEQQIEEFDARTHGLGRRLMQLLAGVVERGGGAPGASDPITIAGGVESVLQHTYGETAGPEMRTDDQLYIEGLKALLYSFAERGDVVLVGRGSQALLTDREGTLHVRVVCPRDERVRRIMGRYDTTEETARERVERSDRARQAWHRKYFDVDYRSPYLYHLMLNTGRMSDQLARDLIVQAVREREPRLG